MALILVDTTPDELVVLKPAGVASELPRDPAADSVVMRLAAQGYSGLRLVHRLDTPTSGLLVAARSAPVAAHYAREIAARRWRKFYVALVAVSPDAARTLLGAHKAFLKADGRGTRVVRAGGKPSFLDVVHVAPTLTSSRESLLLVQLHTGRLHQIRVMLAHAGAPLCGDVAYGGPPRPTMYLEHVLLSARPYGSNHSRVWLAPPHADRLEWSSSLEAAVSERAAGLTRADADDAPVA
jgi:23S rRNA-/tRNA-specific pseudouridylate synthase